jgi:hypothetical protein
MRFTFRSEAVQRVSGCCLFSSCPHAVELALG